MPVRPVNAARSVFAPHVNDILTCVDRAFGLYVGEAGPLLRRLETRTKKGIIRDLVVEELHSWADVTRGVHFFERGNLKWFMFSNNWIVRVKNVDEDFSAAVSPTNDSDAFDRNEIPESIAETLLSDEPATALYLGCMTTENAPLTPQVSLICNNEFAERHWVWPLSGDGPAPTLRLPVPVAPSGGGSGESVRVRLKGAPGGATKKNNG